MKGAEAGRAACEQRWAVPLRARRGAPLSSARRGTPEPPSGGARQRNRLISPPRRLISPLRGRWYEPQAPAQVRQMGQTNGAAGGAKEGGSGVGGRARAARSDERRWRREGEAGTGPAAGASSGSDAAAAGD